MRAQLSAHRVERLVMRMGTPLQPRRVGVSGGDRTGTGGL
ncbi:Uncharacterised protein [Mycobacteroides abscessus subsp. massiliense]|nr:Uncharacterised protein [Mycobacteroides abscessus subsp. massiliense]